MPTYAADDYSVIRARLEEIKKEAAEPKTERVSPDFAFGSCSYCQEWKQPCSGNCGC